MKGRHGKSYIAVPMGCGLFVTVDLREGVTEAEAIEGVRKAHRKMLFIALPLAVFVLLSLFLLE